MGHFRGLKTIVAAAAVAVLGACASQPPQANEDAIFKAVPGGRNECYYAQDNRNKVVRGATSTVGQAAVGGAAGGLIGNQFGGKGAGQNIATGVGAAAGLAAGAWNAQRMKNNRIRQCQQARQQPLPPGGQPGPRPDQPRAPGQQPLPQLGK